MLLSLKINNCLIYGSEVEFSMRANMHYKRFPDNVAAIQNSNVLKSAILIGPNNSGKTNFVRIISMLKNLMLGNSAFLEKNLFSSSPLVELSVAFLEHEHENLFEIKYDVEKKEYLYERFALLFRDKYKNKSETNLLIRDIENRVFFSKDEGLETVMRAASRSNILIHLLNTDEFSELKKIKDTIISFASRIDVVDMNNIPIRKTIDLMKSSENMHRKIANFVRNADLYLDDYKYLNDDEVRIELNTESIEGSMPQEKVLRTVASTTEMLHLASVYKGISVPSLFFDSTGTKKMAALASYILDALEKGRILVVDELDNSLHFRLTRAIIALFNNELNKNAQLIATVHDVSLLDCQTLFRKEQIWFTYKDQSDTYLYSLADFTAEGAGVRDTSDLIDKYRKGVFSALPEPDLFQSLLEVTGNG